MKRLLLVMIMPIVFLAACGGKEIETNMSQNVGDFNFTTQDNDTLSNEDLEGKWWIADFIFTNCTTVCLPMTSNMSILQDRIKEEGLDTQIVSFSVDPDYDTPEVLQKYADEYGADLDNWTFLTGYDFDKIRKLSIESFKSALQEPPEGSDQVSHGIRFYLVNPDGEIIKSWDGTKQKSIDYIIEDLKTVQ